MKQTGEFWLNNHSRAVHSDLGVMLLFWLSLGLLLPLISRAGGPVHLPPDTSFTSGGGDWLPSITEPPSDGKEDVPASSKSNPCATPTPCASPSPTPKYTDLIVHQTWKFLLRRAADNLDDVSKMLEEYGSLTMSDVLLAPAGGNFKVGLANTTGTFYSDAKTNVEGSAASRFLSSQSFSAGLDVSDTWPAGGGVATAAPAASGTATSGTSGGTSNASQSSSLAESITDLATATQNLSTNFKSILPALQPGQTEGVPDRVALNIAAGDSATQSLLNFLGDPAAAAKFKDQIIFVGVVTVGVNPGWRTKKDFAGQIVMRTEYDYSKARPSLLQKIISDDEAATAAKKAMDDAAAALVAAQSIADDYGLIVANRDAASAQTASAKAAADSAQKQASLTVISVSMTFAAAKVKADTDDVKAKTDLKKKADTDLIAAKGANDSVAITNASAEVALAVAQLQVATAQMTTDSNDLTEITSKENNAGTDANIAKQLADDAQKLATTKASAAKDALSVYTDNANNALTDAANARMTVQGDIRKLNADQTSLDNTPPADRKAAAQALADDRTKLGKDSQTDNQDEEAVGLADALAKVAIGATDPAAAANLVIVAKKNADTAKANYEAMEKLPAPLVSLAKLQLEEMQGHLMDSGSVCQLFDQLPKEYIFDHEDPSNPSVAGVTPMTDGQTLDLQDQNLQENAFALQIAAALAKANLKGQAKAFEQYVQSRQKEAQTVSNNGTVNTFSASGGVFGIEIGPRLKALADPASRRGGSGNILDRQSFPAMLIFCVDQRDIVPKVVWDKLNNEWCIGEPAFVVTQTTRWKPLTHAIFSFQDITNPYNWHAPRLSEFDRQEVMVKLNDSMNALEKLSGTNDFNGDRLKLSQPFDNYTMTYALLKERYTTMKYLLNGSAQEESLPLELDFPSPVASTSTSIDTITPTTISIEADGNDVLTSPSGAFSQEVYVLGSNLNLSSTASAQLIAADTSSSAATGFNVTAAFTDTGSINPNYRKVTVTFTPNANKIVPQFAMYNLEISLDPAKVPAGTDTSKPIKSPPIALVRKEPVVGLKPVLSSVLSNGTDTLKQSISVDPSLPSDARDNAGKLIYHGEDKEGIQTPGPGSRVLFWGTVK